ncbi:MAG: hypothetical protein HQL36_10060 [Alphaproteobacteria bacterium]|nr:hypothetical protein [Alphaproteobacteria bacterium]
MTHRNIASVSWGDHLAFGEGDGRLDTPDAIARRMARWRDDLDAGIVHWRALDWGVARYSLSDQGNTRTEAGASPVPGLDEKVLVPRLAHDLGMEAYLYVTVFDEGWPLAPPEERAVSHHNPQHGRDTSFLTEFAMEHPEYMMVDRSGLVRQWGVPCLAYEAVRAEFHRRFTSLAAATDFDGVFVCLRSQSRPADFADQFGFNEPVRRDYQRIHGRSIDEEPFDAVAWREQLGGYLTQLLAELRGDLSALGKKLGVGAARGDVLGPPLGNATLEWRDWIRRGLVDHLVIGQNSSRCPSMWLDLWPMHRGGGYVQNYLSGENLPPPDEHIQRDYAPVAAHGRTALYVARQWSERNRTEEDNVLKCKGVSGLVFSTFRHDNPGPVARGNWWGLPHKNIQSPGFIR